MLVILLAGNVALAAFEQSDWDLSAGLGGTYIKSGGNDAQTFYWGPYTTLWLQVTENITLRTIASIAGYSFTSTATARGKRQARASLNLLGNTDSFTISTVGFDASYIY